MAEELYQVQISDMLTGPGQTFFPLVETGYRPIAENILHSTYVMRARGYSRHTPSGKACGV